MDWQLISGLVAIVCLVVWCFLPTEKEKGMSERECYNKLYKHKRSK